MYAYVYLKSDFWSATKKQYICVLFGCSKQSQTFRYCEFDAGKLQGFFLLLVFSSPLEWLRLKTYLKKSGVSTDLATRNVG